MTEEELKSADTRSLISALQYCGRDSYYATYYDEVVDEITKRLNRIVELEKENAELKEWKEQTIKARGRDYMDWSRMKDQLTKAKELLNEFLDFESSCMERGIYISDKIRAEAEQFLAGEK